MMDKYARKHRDGRVLCWRQHCGFCFGEVGQDSIVYIDPGFIRAPAIDVNDNARTARYSDYRDADIPTLGLVLTSPAHHAFREAKRSRKMHTFRAPGRHGREAFPVFEDVKITCPACRDHVGAEWQVVSPEHLGAFTLADLPAGVATTSLQDAWHRLLRGEMDSERFGKRSMEMRMQLEPWLQVRQGPGKPKASVERRREND